MAPSAPCCIPIEIRPVGGLAPRLFRMARSLSPQRIALVEGLPDDPSWLRGEVALRFFVPGGPQPVECNARARELVLDEGTPLERAALAAFDLHDLPPEAALRIESYVVERLEQV